MPQLMATDPCDSLFPCLLIPLLSCYDCMTHHLPLVMDLPIGLLSTIWFVSVTHTTTNWLSDCLPTTYWSLTDRLLYLPRCCLMPPASCVYKTPSLLRTSPKLVLLCNTGYSIFRKLVSCAITLRTTIVTLFRVTHHNLSHHTSQPRSTACPLSLGQVQDLEFV